MQFSGQQANNRLLAIVYTWLGESGIVLYIRLTLTGERFVISWGMLGAFISAYFLKETHASAGTS